MNTYVFTEVLNTLKNLQTSECFDKLRLRTQSMKKSFTNFRSPISDKDMKHYFIQGNCFDSATNL